MRMAATAMRPHMQPAWRYLEACSFINFLLRRHGCGDDEKKEHQYSHAVTRMAIRWHALLRYPRGFHPGNTIGCDVPFSSTARAQIS